MALTDWEQVQDPDSQGAVESPVDTGTYSYQLDGNFNRPVVILKQSSSDSPTQGKIKTRCYIKPGCRVGTVFRYQNNNNYYILQADDQNDYVQLRKIVSGNK